jgi:hypothetical protein
MFHEFVLLQLSLLLRRTLPLLVFTTFILLSLAVVSVSRNRNCNTAALILPASNSGGSVQASPLAYSQFVRPLIFRGLLFLFPLWVQQVYWSSFVAEYAATAGSSTGADAESVVQNVRHVLWHVVRKSGKPSHLYAIPATQEKPSRFLLLLCGYKKATRSLKKKKKRLPMNVWQPDSTVSGFKSLNVIQREASSRPMAIESRERERDRMLGVAFREARFPFVFVFLVLCMASLIKKILGGNNPPSGPTLRLPTVEEVVRAPQWNAAFDTLTCAGSERTPRNRDHGRTFSSSVPLSYLHSTRQGTGVVNANRDLCARNANSQSIVLVILFSFAPGSCIRKITRPSIQISVAYLSFRCDSYNSHGN